MVTDAETAVSELHSRRILTKLKGVEELGVTFVDLVRAIRACKTATGDITKLEDMAAIFMHPRSLALHILSNLKINGADITSHIKKAISDKETQNWYDMGF